MGVFKADFYRFFAFGFAAGAMLVFTGMSDDPAGAIARDVVPLAVAAPVR